MIRMIPLLIVGFTFSCSSTEDGAVEEPFNEDSGNVAEVTPVEGDTESMGEAGAADVVLSPGQSADLAVECVKKNVPKGKIKTKGTITQVVGQQNHFLVELKNVAASCDATSVKAKAEMNKAKKSLAVKMQTKIAKCACTAKVAPFVVAFKKAPPPGLALIVINEGISKQKPAFRGPFPASVQASGKKNKKAMGPGGKKPGAGKKAQGKKPKAKKKAPIEE